MRSPWPPIGSPGSATVGSWLAEDGHSVLAGH